VVDVRRDPALHARWRAASPFADRGDADALRRWVEEQSLRAKSDRDQADRS
jgi:hypothetical protein